MFEATTPIAAEACAPKQSPLEEHDGDSMPEEHGQIGIAKLHIDAPAATIGLDEEDEVAEDLSAHFANKISPKAAEVKIPSETEPETTHPRASLEQETAETEPETTGPTVASAVELPEEQHNVQVGDSLLEARTSELDPITNSEFSAALAPPHGSSSALESGPEPNADLDAVPPPTPKPRQPPEVSPPLPDGLPPPLIKEELHDDARIWDPELGLPMPAESQVHRGRVVEICDNLRTSEESQSLHHGEKTLALKASGSAATSVMTATSAPVVQHLECYTDRVVRCPCKFCCSYTWSMIIFIVVGVINRPLDLETDFSAFVKADGPSQRRRDAYLLALEEKNKKGSSKSKSRRLQEDGAEHIAKRFEGEEWWHALRRHDELNPDEDDCFDDLCIMPSTSPDDDDSNTTVGRRLATDQVKGMNNYFSKKTLTLVYTSSSGNALSDQTLQDIRTFEQRLVNLPGWLEFCVQS
jgi:hypothetical protein